MARSLEIREVPGVLDALATADPGACGRRIARILANGGSRLEVVRTVAGASARRFRATMPPPHTLPALSAAMDLEGFVDDPHLPVVQACALAASEWGDDPLAAPRAVVSGDELHLGRSFLSAVAAGNAEEAEAIFAGLVREGEERRLAGDVLFEACAPDLAGDGHKLSFTVALWRLARALEWRPGVALIRPAVRLLVGTERDLSAYATTMREIGRSRLDLELAARNVGVLDDVARNGYAIALGVGPDRIVSEIIGGLKRGRSARGYADLVAASAAEQVVADADALEGALYAHAVRYVLGFSRTETHVQALLLAARRVAERGAPDLAEPARIADPEAALNELVLAVEGEDVREAVRLSLALTPAIGAEAVARALVRVATLEDAPADAGHRLLYAAAAVEILPIAPAATNASLAALLARTPSSRTVAEGL